MENIQTNIPQLIPQSITYKMIIPLSVEKKIRFLCNKIHNIEWSGVLFYTIEGSFKDNNLVINCKDIFQMDEGSGSYTEYTITSDIASYLVDHPELTSMYQGHIHSHHNMSAFFSDTDDKTLKEEGNNTAHFVSLIVNNVGQYIAAVTRKLSINSTVDSTINYKTWGNKHASEHSKYTDNKVVIQKFNLDIIKEEEVDPIEEEMTLRLQEIRDKKKKENMQHVNDYIRTNKFGDYKKENNYRDLFTYIPTKQDIYNNDLDDIISLKEDVVLNDLYKQLIIGTPIALFLENVNIYKWEENYNNLYKKRFPKIEDYEDWITNYLITLIDEIDISAKYPELKKNVLEASIAYTLAKKIDKNIKGDYSDVLIKSLYENYIY